MEAAASSDSQQWLELVTLLRLTAMVDLLLHDNVEGGAGTARYYVHTQPAADGDHEVHRDGCSWMPMPENRKYLGDFAE